MTRRSAGLRHQHGSLYDEHHVKSRARNPKGAQIADVFEKSCENIRSVGMNPILSLGPLLLAQSSVPSPAPVLVTLSPHVGADRQVSGLKIVETIETSAEPLRLQMVLRLPVLGLVADSLSEVRATDGIGALTLEVVDDPDTAPDPSRHWIAKRPVKYPVTVSYVVAVRPPAEGGPPFGSKAAGGGIAGNARSVILSPEARDLPNLRLQWDLSAMPPGSIGAWNVGDGTVTLPKTALHDQWFLAGPALVQRGAGDSGFRGYAIGHGLTDPAATLSWANRAYDILSNTFGYQGKPSYAFFLRIVAGTSLATGTATAGGSLVSTGETFLKTQNPETVLDASFHEMTHQWVGQFAGEQSWFSEGLTVFFTETLRLQNQMGTAAQIAQGLNRPIRNYYASRARTWSQERIAATPFEDEEVRLVPYGRGLLYFAELDSAIRHASGGQRSLASVLKPLFAARARGVELDQAAWETMLRRELGEAAVQQFRDTVITGVRIPLPAADAFGPALCRIESPKVANGGSPAPTIPEWIPRQADGSCAVASAPPKASP